jgi:hypothetical protein
MKKAIVPKDISPHELELLLREAAVREGRCVPETARELEIVEKRLAGKIFSIPKFATLLARLRGGAKESQKVIHLKAHFNEDVIEDLAMAARNGGKIPDRVRKQMDADRQEKESPSQTKLC